MTRDSINSCVDNLKNAGEKKCRKKKYTTTIEKKIHVCKCISSLHKYQFMLNKQMIKKKNRKKINIHCNCMVVQITFLYASLWIYS